VEKSRSPAIAVSTDAQGFSENKDAASAGGEITGSARRTLQEKLGKSILSSREHARTRLDGAVDGLKWDANSYLKFIWGKALPNMTSRAGVSLRGSTAT
jgi:hypothetical protein